VSPAPCISSKEVSDHFGQEPELHVQPPELGGFTYEYQFPWGALRFAFGCEEPPCLKVIVIDAILPKSPEKE
jgi:hypothetical protein